MPNAKMEAVLLFNLVATKDRLAMSGDLLGRSLWKFGTRGAGPPRRVVNYRPKMNCCFRSVYFFYPEKGTG